MRKAFIFVAIAVYHDHEVLSRLEYPVDFIETPYSPNAVSFTVLNHIRFHGEKLGSRELHYW